MNSSPVKIHNNKAINQSYITIANLIIEGQYQTAVGLTLKGDKSFPIRLAVKVGILIALVNNPDNAYKYLKELALRQ